MVAKRMLDTVRELHPPQPAAAPRGSRGTKVLLRHRYLASAGVSALYQARDQFAAHQQELTLLAGPGSPAAAVLELVNLLCAARSAAQ